MIKTGMIKAWHPPDEATAASTLAVLVEWLRATARLPDADPDTARAWAARDAAGFAAFAGLHQAAGNAANRTRHAGPQEALVLRRDGNRQSWSRDALKEKQPPLPPDIAAALHSGTWHHLVASAAWHLLHAETRPDDRLLWDGDPADPWALGALTCGATLILADARPTIAREEQAKTFRPPPSGPDAG
jgi:hypothetical protein